MPDMPEIPSDFQDMVRLLRGLVMPAITTPETPEIKVAIIGAGMAGLTAALRLAERGYKVTVYEQKPYIGGQFGAHTHDGNVYHEHSYHMLLNWYHNFWQIVREVGVDLERDLEPRTAVRHLARGDSRMPALTNPGSSNYVWGNLFSGVAPPPDMFLYAYSLIDLLAQSFDPNRLLDEYTVNGFVQSRPYASERSAELHQDTLAKAFASPSYLSSAASYKNLIKYGFRQPDPMMWILKGDSERLFHQHVGKRLKDLGCRILTSRRASQITFTREASKPSAPYVFHAIKSSDVKESLGCVLGYEESMVTAPPVDDVALTQRQADGQEPLAVEEYDYLILAVAPKSFPPLIENARFQDFLLDTPSKVKLSFPPIPKFRVQPMASLDLYFNKRLPGIPKEHVVLLGSEYGLTFIDNSQAWPGLQTTVLNVVVSDFPALANLEPRKALDAILVELKKYIPFDVDRDLDKPKTHFQTNIGNELFVNEVGSEKWRPETKTPIPNLFLAGDYCRTVIDVVTIEAAVVSGLEAATALQAAVVAKHHLEPDVALACPITIVEPEAYSETEMAGLKLLLAPYAYGAKMWSWLNELVPPPQPVRPSQLGSPEFQDTSQPSSEFFTDGMRLWLAPWAAAADVWRAGWSLWADVYRQLTR